MLLRGILMEMAERFQREGGQERLTNYPLKPSSVVFDVGGYEGGWTAELLKGKQEACLHCGVKQDPYVYIFEPVKRFYDKCVTRFKDYPKVRVLNFGLSGHDHYTQVKVDEAATGLYADKGDIELIELRSIANFMYAENIKAVDLMSINIEGGEYDLVSGIIDTGIHNLTDVIQIQWHKLNTDSSSDVSRIQRRLRDTHSLLFEYPFVWEAWKRY